MKPYKALLSPIGPPRAPVAPVGAVRGLLPVPHLKARNSEAPRRVAGRGGRHHEGAVGDVLLVELHRHLVVACGATGGPLAGGVTGYLGTGWQWGVINGALGNGVSLMGCH